MNSVGSSELDGILKNQKLFSQSDFHINKQEVAAIQVTEADSYSSLLCIPNGLVNEI